MTEAAPINVFVVIITTKTLHPTYTVGACYRNEQAAKDEVERLNKANSYTKARYAMRQLG